MRPLLLGALLLALAAPAAAQTAFTEFALTDSTLNSDPDTDFWIKSAAPADVDADGDLDLMVVGYYVNYHDWVEERITFYRNDGPVGDTTWALTPVQIDPGDFTFEQADLVWGDYDNDGDPDVVVAAYDEPVALFRNDDGALVRTATELPAYYEGYLERMDLESLSWADYDNDGDLDLLIPATATEDEEYAPTRIFRNDGPGAGDAWTFTDTGMELPGAEVMAATVSIWGDDDADGDLDLLLANISQFEDNFLHTFRNEGGTLVPAATGLAHIRHGNVDWADADNDGDLDILYAGNIDLPNGTGDTVVRILFKRDDGTGYDPFTIVQDVWPPSGEHPWSDFNSVAWADYDSDGDVDLLVTGDMWGGGNNGSSLVYVNDGAGVFTPIDEVLPAPLNGHGGGAFTWFDIDADGDLDYFVAGAYFIPGGNGLVEARTQLFRNDAPGANAAPTAPGLLTADPAGDAVTLSWAAASDDGTPADGLTYNLWVRAAPGSDIVSPMARPDGVRRIPEPGNVSHNTSWILRDLPDGTYTWTVQAVDNAFNGGTFAAEGTFSVGAVATAPGAVPAALALRGVTPNPAAVGAAVRFDLPTPAEVSVTVFDALGREVLALPAQAVEAGADRALALDVRALPAGAYLVRLAVDAGGTMEMRTGRLTVVR
jgi:hypothetical protein